MVSVGCTQVVCVLLFLGRWVGVEHPTMGDGIFPASTGPDLTVAPGVKSVMEPFERGPVHGGREMKPSHWKSYIPIRFPKILERKAGGVWALEAIGVGTGQALIDLLGLQRG